MSILSPEDLLLQKGFSFGPVVGENKKKWVLNPLPVEPKQQMGLVFWVPLLETVRSTN
jgi:hypothetical protein